MSRARPALAPDEATAWPGDFRALAEALPVIVWTAEAAGATTYMNQAWTAYTGVAAERSLGEGWLECLHPDDRGLAAENWRRAASAGRDYSDQWRLRRADGTYRWWLSRAVPQKDESGTVQRWLGTSTDIEDLKLAQTEISGNAALVRIAGEAARLGGWALDVAGTHVAWSDEVCAIHEVPRGTVPTLEQAVNFYAPECRPTIIEAVERCIRDGIAFDLESEIITAAGCRLAVRAMGHAMRGPGGRVTRIQGAFQDISDRKRAEESLRRKARQQELIAAFGRLALACQDLDELHAEVVKLAKDGMEAPFAKVLQLAPDGQSLIIKAALGWRPGWVEQSIHKSDEEGYHLKALMTGKPLVVSDFRAEPRLHRSETVYAHGILSGAEVPVIGPGGLYGVLGVFWTEARSFSDQDLDFLRSLANTLESAVERKATEEKLARMAQFDPLTGLPNRNLFHDRLSQALTQAGRNGWMFAVLFIDIDRFKLVNDTLGHRAGDAILQSIARRLEQCTRSGDTVSRLSGDEFAVILCNLARTDDAALVAQKIVAACATPSELDGKQIYVSASVGIALYPGEGADPGALLEHADIAMYRAKEQGRSRYQFYLPEMHERAMARLEVEIQLRHALNHGEFLLHYQPKADLYTGELCGFEALLRWSHPHRGLVQPADFVPVLEDTGLIVPVGEWVLRRACMQAKAWQDDGLSPRVVAVNVSARQFQAPDFGRVVADALAETGLDPRLLELEVTESLLMRDPDEAAELLRTLKALGVHLTIDDFGTGYSSLAYLKRFPLDTLKIDRTFIRDCVSDADDATIALSVINLAHSLKLKVIAEGVETEAQLNLLRSHGCDEIQGYYVGQPGPAADATALLRNGLPLRLPRPADRPDATTVLLVDDNRDDLLIFHEALCREGYHVLLANHPRTALDMLAANRVDMVISDQNMPAMSGVRFLAAVRTLYPEVIRVMLTAGTGADTISDAVNDAGVHKFLSKHWDAERFSAEVREAQRRHQPPARA